mmetsp:Transcript_27793/g.62263  ORF Transcript_27793/g.62263 Transcript_27793/m.62263 type:complete len:441 (-) Transcript_27793:70-1392(-)
MWALLLVLLGCLQVSRSFRSDALPSQKIFTRQPVGMVSTDSQPQSDRSLRTAGLWRALRVGGAAAAGVMVATRPAPSKAAELVLPECSDTIIALRNAAGRQIVVIGTAHISEDSVRLVRSTIRALNPDTVMIELDKKRVGKVNEGKTLKELGFAVPQDQEEGPIVVDGKAGRKNLFMQVVDSVRDSFTSSVQGAAGAVLGKALGQFYNSVEKLGFTAGGEFKAAVEEARTSGATVLLGDRNVDVTLQRLASAISSVDGDRFTALMEKMAAAEDELGLKLDAPGPDGVKKVVWGVGVSVWGGAGSAIYVVTVQRNTGKDQSFISPIPPTSPTSPISHLPPLPPSTPLPGGPGSLRGGHEAEGQRQQAHGNHTQRRAGDIQRSHRRARPLHGQLAQRRCVPVSHGSGGTRARQRHRRLPKGVRIPAPGAQSLPTTQGVELRC